MKPSPLAYAVALLALTTVAASSLAWYQHRKLLELQELAARNAAERDEWQSKLAAVERPPLMAAGPIPSTEAPATPDLPSPADVVATDAAGPRGGPRRGDRINPMVSLMQNPEFARAMVTQQKAALDLRYADLFRQLNLSPEQVDRLKNLLIERQSAAADVMAAAREQGIEGRDAREQLRELVRTTQAETDEAIRAYLGESGYDAYKTYEQTQPQRMLVGQLETKLSYSSTPLQTAQMDQLVRILAETAPDSGRGGSGNNAVFAVRGMDAGGPMPFGGSGSVQITDEALARAQGILSSSQLAALQQMQAEQQAQRTMAEAVRNATRNNRGGNQGGPVPSPAP